MKKSIRVLAAALVLTLATNTYAYADPVLECSQQASSNIEIGDCLVGVEETVNMSLEQVLSFATDAARELDRVTGRDVAVPALLDSQGTWLAYRDKHCDFVGSTFGGGSGTGAAIRGCRIELSRDRVDDLLRYAQ